MNLGLGIGPTFIGPAFLWSPSRLRVGTRVVQDLTFDPSRLFSDVAGETLIAGPGAEVAAQKDARGVIELTQTTLAARPIYARKPASGVRNRANGSAAVGNAAFWNATSINNGITGTKLTSGVTPGGNAWVRYQISGTSTAVAAVQFYNQAQARTPAASGQSWTASALCRIESGASGDAGSGLRTLVVEETAPSTVVAGDVSSVHKGATLTAVTVTRAMTTGNQMRGHVEFRVSDSQTVDCIVYVEALQFELGTARTAWQANLSQFDVTEAGVRDTYWLAGNGVNHFMSLTEDFEPAGGYTIAAVMSGPSPAILGSAGSAGARLFSGSDGEILYRANDSTNQITTGVNPVVTGRHVIIIRVSGAETGQIFVNGLPVTSFVTGNLIPTQAISTLMRSNTRFSSADTAGAVLVDQAIGDAEVSMLNRYLLAKGGIAL